MRTTMWVAGAEVGGTAAPLTVRNPATEATLAEATGCHARPSGSPGESTARSGCSTAPGIPDDMTGSASGRGCETIPPRLIVEG